MSAVFNSFFTKNSKILEQPITYDEMGIETGFTILYTPRDDGGVTLQATSDTMPAIEAAFSALRLDEAHILYTEATELLRSRAKMGQRQADIRRAIEVLFALSRGEKVSAEDIAAASAPRIASTGEPPVNKPIDVDGIMYERLLVKSRLITTKDTDLLPIIKEFVGPHARPDDILFVSEKALSITQGKIIDYRDIHPGALARLLARNVGIYYGTSDFHGFGHGTTIGMQLFIEEAGYPRAIFAAIVSAITRPFGIRGLFYSLCGKRAKSVDLPMSFLILEYAHAAKLAPDNSTGNAKRIKAVLGCEVVILDSNYRGAFSLGKSTWAISERFIGKLFRDNPMGQSDEMTPFCIVRRSSDK